MNLPGQFEILGVPLSVVDMEGALAWVADQVAEGDGPKCVVAANPEKVYHLRKSEFLSSFFRQAGLVIPDGIGMVFALKLLHGIRIGRVPGADLMQHICAQAERLGHRIFLYGASEEVSSGAMRKLQERHPELRIVGVANGFVTSEEQPELIRRIRDSQAQILFVGMGSPRQERWVAEHLEELPEVRVVQCIGGTLDILDGRVRRAPAAFQRVGLEWLYRLLLQPTRIGRQLKLGVFVLEVLWKRCSRSVVRRRGQGRSFPGSS